MKKCKTCNKPFEPYKSTDPCCSYPCTVAFYQEKEIEKRHKELISKVKEIDSLSKLMKTAKELVQRFARLRDKNLPCISCGTNKAYEWHGGHLFKSELYSGVRLEEININKQCGQCNTFKNGNEAEYVAGFIKRYSIQDFTALHERALKTKNKKWNKEELIQIINKYKQKNKDYDTI